MIFTKKRRRGTWLAAGVLTLASVTGSALVATSSASATPVEASSGSLAWGVKSSLRNYVGIQLAAIAGTIGTPGMGGGAAPVGTRIVPFDGATFDAASAPASGSNPAETKAYLFPVAGGVVTDAQNLTIDFAGGVEYWFPSHVFDIKFSDLSLVVANGVATIRGDLSVAIPVNWNGVALGTGWTAPTPTISHDVDIATVASAAVTINGDNVSVTASGVAFTAAAANAFIVPAGALGPEPVQLYAAGTAIDNFSVTATLGEEEPAPSPQISLSQTQFSPSGDVTVTVSGSGFDFEPEATTAQGAPTTSSGFYVYAGKVANNWKPSGGNGSGTRATVGAVSVCAWGATASSQGCQLLLQPDGTFTATVTFSKDSLDAAAAAKPDPSILTNYGILTVAASGKIIPSYELFKPISFLTPGQQVITAEIPVQPGGSFGWSIPQNSPVAMGAPVNHGAYFESAGAINTVTVTDSRTAQDNSWALAGQVSDFVSGTDTFSGSYLGWTPEVISGAATAGDPIEPGYPTGDGLKEGGTLASAPNGHAAGNAELGADLLLRVPVQTPAGTYTATLTVTLLG